ncbi:hypothetical protein Tco_0095356 [Tanacetum coccineum]
MMSRLSLKNDMPLRELIIVTIKPVPVSHAENHPSIVKSVYGIGYSKETMGYSFYCPPGNKVFVARNAKFFENSLITQEASGSVGY